MRSWPGRGRILNRHGASLGKGESVPVIVAAATAKKWRRGAQCLCMSISLSRTNERLTLSQGRSQFRSVASADVLGGGHSGGDDRACPAVT